MSFSIDEFYEKLDQMYSAHDIEATENFLLEMVEKTRSLHDVDTPPISCPSCVQTPTVNLEYISVCNEAACFFRGISSYEKSISYFEKALNELAMFFQKRSINYATILLNMAGTLRLQKEYDRSIAAFNEAEEIFLSREEPDNYRLASINNNLCLVYQDMGDYNKASACIEKALELLPQSDMTIVERATSLNILAVLYERLGRYDDAMVNAQKSIEIFEKLDGGNNAHYPASLNTKAILLNKMGRYEECIELLKTALAKTESIYGKNIDYVNCLYNLADSYRKTGREDEAANCICQAEKIASTLK